MRNDRFCLPSWWIPGVLKHSFIVLAAAICLTCAITFFIVDHFKINTDLTQMISNDLHFRKIARIFHDAFPALHNNIVVVIEAETPEQAV
ncbi:MAG: hypothetical protein R6T90_07265, partial [Dissulfuribacterales bacterium]